MFLNWLLGVEVAHAAADADLIAAVTSLASTTQENATGSIYAVLPYIAILVALIVGIRLVIGLFKRSAR